MQPRLEPSGRRPPQGTQATVSSSKAYLASTLVFPSVCLSHHLTYNDHCQVKAESGLDVSRAAAGPSEALGNSSAGPLLLGPRFPGIAHHTTASFLPLDALVSVRAGSTALLEVYNGEITAVRLEVDEEHWSRLEKSGADDDEDVDLGSLLRQLTHLRELHLPFPYVHG